MRLPQEQQHQQINQGPQQSGRGRGSRRNKRNSSQCQDMRLHPPGSGFSRQLEGSPGSPSSLQELLLVDEFADALSVPVSTSLPLHWFLYGSRTSLTKLHGNSSEACSNAGLPACRPDFRWTSCPWLETRLQNGVQALDSWALHQLSPATSGQSSS